MIPHAISARQPNRLPWSRMRLQHERAIALGFAVEASSVRSYTSAFQSYLSFCKNHHIPIDPTPDTLSLFVVYMCSHIRPSSVRSYLSGICHALEDTFPDVRANRNSRLVSRTLAGCFKRIANPVQRKRAFSLEDLQLLLNTYARSDQYNDKLFLVMTFTAFWGLLRLGEVAVPDSLHLRAPKKRTLRHPTSITEKSYTISLPYHKADRFYEGNKILIPARPDAFNPVPIFSRYVDARDNLHGLKPFLWTQADGSPPTRSWFMARLHRIFPRDVGGHSLRAGGATAYALQGVPDDRIQGLGRWSSDTFKIYIRKNPTLLHALITGSEESNTTTLPNPAIDLPLSG
jgi:hypothetical protein